ncbi:hypothetical protein HYN46_13555 [Aquirhabdus parva]|uniref:Uncharacterized protein n=1 Tax=Aquirhabdus parva TaxID=2283318 RepID=A0A345P909_9GAMM|nr:hypothetical protein HYN46_13555 [Aquirhabdus parva]
MTAAGAAIHQQLSYYIHMLMIIWSFHRVWVRSARKADAQTVFCDIDVAQEKLRRKKSIFPRKSLHVGMNFEFLSKWKKRVMI